MAITKGNNPTELEIGAGITAEQIREWVAAEVNHAIREAIPGIISAVHDEVVLMLEAARRQEPELEEQTKKRKPAQAVAPESAVLKKTRFSDSLLNQRSGGFKTRDGSRKRIDGCFKCGQVGHYGRDCSREPNTVCFNCNQIGHVKANCPTARATDGDEAQATLKTVTGTFLVNSVPDVALFDSGATPFIFRSSHF